ncbi:hypothetical protein [Paraliomyxa miuraensis]|uniref:hypothetical protein n=1 Tax=Paraliomyxa miuraensis TaxID=376150 RepID=UPI00225246ED|nr:hypothetical protein [Paraliomyxa miuraensis]MCX4241133.1 hypothetical protein [Paraliomyxa miuraensis]
MSDEREAIIDGLIAKALDEHGDLAPPWARHPDIPKDSIGWRMGAGEGWLMMWWQWMERQPTDRTWRLAYLQRHAPAPRSWQRSAMWVLDPTAKEDYDDHEDDGDEDEVAGVLDERQRALLHELEHAGVVGDDVAILAWLRLADPPGPPWDERRTVATAVRYDARSLSFLARWARDRRNDGTLARWLEAVAEPSPGWRAFRDALASGQPPARLPDDPREQLAILLAAYGEPPSPWSRGESPEALELQFEDDTSFAGAWVEWAMESFDDRTTWLGYLSRGPAAPPEWDQAVRRELSWLFRAP